MSYAKTCYTCKFSTLTINSRHLCKMSWRRLQNVLKTSWRCRKDVFARRLEDVLKTSWRRMAKMNIMVLIKTSSEDEDERHLQDVFIKTNFCWEESFWKSFSFSFFAKCFDRNFKCFLSCNLPFLNVMKVEDSKNIKRYISITFYENN